MSKLRFRSLAFAAAVVGAAGLLGSGLFHGSRQAEAAGADAAKSADERPAAASNTTADEQAIRKAGQAYVEALNKGDLDALIGVWTPEADYINAAGQLTRGRDAISAVLKNALAEMKGYKVTCRVHSIRFLRPEVALEDGALEYTAPDGSHSAHRYAATWLKAGDRWLIGSVRDLPAESGDMPSLASPHLQSFEWLVGNWDDGKTGNVRLTCRWAPNKSFLLMDYIVQRHGEEPLQVTQRVGWDPVNNQVRSWVFDSAGGYGDGLWERQGNRWVVGCSGVLPDGGSGEATNSYEFVDGQHFVWRSTARTVDGQPLPDAEVKFTRATPSK